MFINGLQTSRLCNCPCSAATGNPKQLAAGTGVCVDTPTIRVGEKIRVENPNGYCDDYFVLNVCTDAIVCCSGNTSKGITYEPCGGDGAYSPGFTLEIDCNTFVSVSGFTGPQGPATSGNSNIISSGSSWCFGRDNDPVVKTCCIKFPIKVTGIPSGTEEDTCYQVKAYFGCTDNLPHFKGCTSSVDTTIVCFEDKCYPTGHPNAIKIQDQIDSKWLGLPQQVVTTGVLPGPLEKTAE